MERPHAPATDDLSAAQIFKAGPGFAPGWPLRIVWSCALLPESSAIPTFAVSHTCRNLSITGSDHLQVVPKLVANGGEKFVVPE